MITIDRICVHSRSWVINGSQFHAQRSSRMNVYVFLLG